MMMMNKQRYLSNHFAYFRHRLSKLMSFGRGALSIPVLEFFAGFHVQQTLQASNVIMYQSEILVLDSTAHLTIQKRTSGS